MSEDLTSELMDALGDDGFFALTEAYAGTRLYVPGNPSRSDLSTTIGVDHARRLSQIFPGSYIKVPLARTFRALRYRSAGASNAEVARRLGLTENGVERLFARANKAKPQKARKSHDERQIDLFRG